MIVVSDTTLLISLSKIDCIDLLEKFFGQVLIPQAVFEELTVDERFKFVVKNIVHNRVHDHTMTKVVMIWL